jgi:hypothetical protein
MICTLLTNRSSNNHGYRQQRDHNKSNHDGNVL